MRTLRVNDTLEAHYQAMTSQTDQHVAPISAAGDLAGLFAVAQLLWQTLTPVRPAEGFRSELGRGLVAEAERRRVHQVLGISGYRPTRPVWLMSVAALGTASLVGAYAYWRFSRSGDQGERRLAA